MAVKYMIYMGLLYLNCLLKVNNRSRMEWN